MQLMKTQVAQDARGDTVKFSGSTAVVFILCGVNSSSDSSPAAAEATPSMMYVSNVGDSRAVLSRAGIAIEMSVDQVPSRPDERARIEVR